MNQQSSGESTRFGDSIIDAARTTLQHDQKALSMLDSMTDSATIEQVQVEDVDTDEDLGKEVEKGAVLRDIHQSMREVLTATALEMLKRGAEIKSIEDMIPQYQSKIDPSDAESFENAKQALLKEISEIRDMAEKALEGDDSGPALRGIVVQQAINRTRRGVIRENPQPPSHKDYLQEKAEAGLIRRFANGPVIGVKTRPFELDPRDRRFQEVREVWTQLNATWSLDNLALLARGKSAYVGEEVSGVSAYRKSEVLADNPQLLPVLQDLVTAHADWHLNQDIPQGTEGHEVDKKIVDEISQFHFGLIVGISAPIEADLMSMQDCEEFLRQIPWVESFLETRGGMRVIPPRLIESFLAGRAVAIAHDISNKNSGDVAARDYLRFSDVLGLMGRTGSTVVTVETIDQILFSDDRTGPYFSPDHLRYFTNQDASNGYLSSQLEQELSLERQNRGRNVVMNRFFDGRISLSPNRAITLGEWNERVPIGRAPDTVGDRLVPLIAFTAEKVAIAEMQTAIVVGMTRLPASRIEGANNITVQMEDVLQSFHDFEGRRLPYSMEILQVVGTGYSNSDNDITKRVHKAHVLRAVVRALMPERDTSGFNEQSLVDNLVKYQLITPEEVAYLQGLVFTAVLACQSVHPNLSLQLVDLVGPRDPDLPNQSNARETWDFGRDGIVSTRASDVVGPGEQAGETPLRGVSVVDIKSRGATMLNGSTKLRTPRVNFDRLMGGYPWHDELKRLFIGVVRETTQVTSATAEYLEALALQNGSVVPEMSQQVQVSLPQIEITEGEGDQSSTLIIGPNLSTIIEALDSRQRSSPANLSLSQQLATLTTLAAELGIPVSIGETTIQPSSDAAFVRLQRIVDVLERVGPDLRKWQEERIRRERGFFNRGKREIDIQAGLTAEEERIMGYLGELERILPVGPNSNLGPTFNTLVHSLKRTFLGKDPEQITQIIQEIETSLSNRFAFAIQPLIRMMKVLTSSDSHASLQQQYAQSAITDNGMVKVPGNFARSEVTNVYGFQVPDSDQKTEEKPVALLTKEDLNKLVARQEIVPRVNRLIVESGIVLLRQQLQRLGYQRDNVPPHFQSVPNQIDSVLNVNFEPGLSPSIGLVTLRQSLAEATRKRSDQLSVGYVTKTLQPLVPVIIKKQAPDLIRGWFTD